MLVTHDDSYDNGKIEAEKTQTYKACEEKAYIHAPFLEVFAAQICQNVKQHANSFQSSCTESYQK